MASKKLNTVKEGITKRVRQTFDFCRKIEFNIFTDK